MQNTFITSIIMMYKLLVFKFINNIFRIVLIGSLHANTDQNLLCKP
jgi:hypothetical protein